MKKENLGFFVKVMSIIVLVSLLIIFIIYLVKKFVLTEKMTNYDLVNSKIKMTKNASDKNFDRIWTIGGETIIPDADGYKYKWNYRHDGSNYDIASHECRGSLKKPFVAKTFSVSNKIEPNISYNENLTENTVDSENFNTKFNRMKSIVGLVSNPSNTIYSSKNENLYEEFKK